MPATYYTDGNGVKRALPVTRHNHDASYSRSDHVHTDDTGWTDFSLANGWRPYSGSYEVPGYRRLNGVVFLRGLLRKSDAAVPTGSTGSTLCTLPAGFRVSGATAIFIGGNSHSTGGIYTHAQRVDIHPSGEIRVVYYNDVDGDTWQSLSGIRFIAEA